MFSFMCLINNYTAYVIHNAVSYMAPPISQVHYVFLFRIYGDLQTYTFLESL